MATQEDEKEILALSKKSKTMGKIDKKKRTKWKIARGTAPVQT